VDQANKKERPEDRQIKTALWRPDIGVPESPRIVRDRVPMLKFKLGPRKPWAFAPGVSA
jgi:hypothetical protein